MQQGLALDDHSIELASPKQCMRHIPDARARSQRREEALNFLLTCTDCLTEVERSQGGESRWLSCIGAGLDLFCKPAGGQLPLRSTVLRLNHRNYPEMCPEF